MVLQSCTRCSVRFYAPETSGQELCWRCDRAESAPQDEVAIRLLAQVFPDGLPSTG